MWDLFSYPNPTTAYIVETIEHHHGNGISQRFSENSRA